MTRKVAVEQRDKVTGDLVATHPSLEAACAALGKSGGQGNISRCCNGKVPSVYGFKWAFAPVVEKADLEGEECGRVERHMSAGPTIFDPEDLGLDNKKRMLTIDGKNWPLHRLVLHVFTDGGIPDNKQVGFKDGTPGNYRLDNLCFLDIRTVQPRPYLLPTR
jgi:hypothetical protein